MSPPLPVYARSPSRSRRLGAVVGRLIGERDGFVLVFVALALPALLGMVGLAIDGARLMTLDAQIAALADAGALAAAKELDRSDDAIARAQRAADAVIDQRWDARSSQDAPRPTVRFAERLSDLRTSATFSLSEAEARQAEYVEVQTGRYSLSASLLELFGMSSQPIRRRAVAESHYVGCDVTPLILCQADPQRFVARAKAGRQYLLRMDGNLFDGSLIALDRPDELNNRSTLRRLADPEPAFCYGDGLALRRNLTARDIDDALNVRFDRYYNGAATIASDLAVYPPAPNIIQGRHLNTCASPPAGGDVNPPYHLPRDQAYRTVRPGASYEEGQGDWKLTTAYGGIAGSTVLRALEEYILWNHDDKDRAFQDGLRNAATRYEIYLRELGLSAATETIPVVTAGNKLAGRTMPTGGPRTGPSAFVRENPTPTCYLGTQPAVQARRRILYAAIADCRGMAAGTSAITLSRDIAKLFMTEPASAGALLVELVSILRPNADDGKLRRIVQLVETE